MHILEVSWLTKMVIKMVRDPQNMSLTIAKLDQIEQTMSLMFDEWTAFRSEIQEGDEVWEYDAPSDYWNTLCGSAGLALVRNGLIVRVLETEIN